MRTFILFTLFTSSVWAAPVGKVITMRGKASYQGSPITPNQLLKGQGEISVGDKSYVRFHFEESGHVIVLAANTKILVDFSRPVGEERVTLLEGISRWISGKIVKKEAAGISTKLGVMGVRGTDFIVSAETLLNETEVVCLAGEISFTNVLNKSDIATVKAGQWGGIGGRFGNHISSVLKLPKEVLSSFETKAPLQ